MLRPNSGNLSSAIKTAGLKDLGMGALFGALLGRAGELVPQVRNLRETNPMAYDALLGASLVAAMGAVRPDEEEEASQAPAPTPIISPPGWSV